MITMEPRQGGWAVLEVRSLITRANLVPRVFSLSNIGKQEDPGDEVVHAQKRRALGSRNWEHGGWFHKLSTEEIGDFISWEWQRYWNIPTSGFISQHYRGTGKCFNEIIRRGKKCYYISWGWGQRNGLDQAFCMNGGVFDGTGHLTL